MKVDLTKVQQLIDNGKTFEAVAEKISRQGGEGEFHFTTIQKALQRGTVGKRLARAISKTFGIPMQKLRSVA